MRYCQNCNAPLSDNANFCERCGAPAAPPVQMPPLPPQPQRMTQIRGQKQRSNTLIISVIAAAVVVIGGILLFVFVNSSHKEAADVATESHGGSNQTFNTETVAGGTDEDQYDWLSQRAVTASDLSGKTVGDLRLMRNAIFARHGYIFQSKDLQQYFENFSWYTPQYSDVTAMLSPLEKKNIDFIKKFEGGSSASGSSKKSGSRLGSVGFTRDYSDYVCYSRLDDSDLVGLSAGELRILRNTIYARHGLKFKSADLRNYFNGFGWYSPRYDNVPESWLSDTEKHNIMLIKRYE